jgi:DNA-binding transcriptional ArsR family regulator
MYLSRADLAILSELEHAHAVGRGVRWDVIAADGGVAHVDLGYHLRSLRDRGLVRGVREFSLNGRTLYEATATPSGRSAIQAEIASVR